MRQPIIGLNISQLQRCSVQIIRISCQLPKTQRFLLKNQSNSRIVNGHISEPLIFVSGSEHLKAINQSSVTDNTNKLFWGCYPTTDTRIRKSLFDNEKHFTTLTESQVLSFSNPS